MLACALGALGALGWREALAGDAPAPPVPARSYVVSDRPAPGAPSPLLAGAPDLARFTVAAVRARLPAELTGRTARVLPIDDLYFLHVSNVIEMDSVWAAAGDEEPRCVLLGAGSYGLESVRQQIDDPTVLDRLADGSYLLRRPVFISPTGKLVVTDGERLLLSVTDGVFVHSSGELLVTDAEVSAWDREAGTYAAREELSPERALLYLDQRPRPYILGAEGSRTYIANSRIRGLGYKGRAGTFGISMAPVASGTRLGRYLRRLRAPTGWLVGNDIEDLFFGFYSNRARDVAIVGNRFGDSVVYGIDPHDYTENLLVARNVTHGSRLAHGIIFSRGVVNSWILDNVSTGNTGSGVMLDRESSENRIVGNLLLANEGDGISVFESSRNLVQDNAIRRNVRNGLHVRNSEDVRVETNEMAANGGSGVELGAVDISGLETRDFALDPFVQRATAELWRNSFVDNGRSAVKTRAVEMLSLFANDYVDSGPAYFAGDIEPIGATLLARELRRSGQVVIERRPVVAPDVTPDVSPDVTGRAPGPEEGAGSAAGRDDRVALELLRRHAEGGAPRAMVSLARHHAKRSESGSGLGREVLYWYGRAIANGWSGAVAELGYLLLGEAAHVREAVVLLAIAELLGDRRASDDLALVPQLVDVTPAEIGAARREARARLTARRLWNGELFHDVPIRLTGDEQARAFRRLKSIDEALARGRPPLSRASARARTPPRLDAERRASHLHYAQDKNAPRIRHEERLEAERASDARALGERRARLDRIERRRRARDLKVAAISERERGELQRELERRVARINRHRDPSAALDAGELMARALRPSAAPARGQRR